MFKLWPQLHLCSSISPHLSAETWSQCAAVARPAAEQHVRDVQPVLSEQRWQEAVLLREAFTFTQVLHWGGVVAGRTEQQEGTMKVYVNAVRVSINKINEVHLLCSRPQGDAVLGWRWAQIPNTLPLCHRLDNRQTSKDTNKPNIWNKESRVLTSLTSHHRASLSMTLDCGRSQYSKVLIYLWKFVFWQYFY